MSNDDLASPLDLQTDAAYRRWREFKLREMPRNIASQRVEIDDLANPTAREISTLQETCRRANWALFRTGSPQIDDKALAGFAAHLGLQNIDRNLCSGENGVTTLSAREQPAGHTYVPYTNRPLSWHTDGYYNPPRHQIRAWILFCVEEAMEGGANSILDHELLYIHLRDRAPELIEALMAPEAMTIPPNIVDGETIRARQTGPVFSINPDGTLHMRYSARKRNISWSDTGKTHAAARAIEALLSSEDVPICHYRLQPGEGIVSNNVLHRREGFRDDPVAGKSRRVLRARFYDRISGTGSISR